MSRYLVALLVTAGFVLLAWSFAVPIFEAPDEPAHWGYARYLHDHRRLPRYSQEYPEANSPPLYYLLVAPFAAASSLPPRSASEQGAMVFPPRFYLNARDDFRRYWPVRAGRLVSMLLSVLTVACCYLAGREATGRAETGLLAGGIAAFWPQFTFRGMNVSNDALVTTLAALTTYLLIRLVRRGFSWPLATVAAIALAGAILSKINAAFLPVPFILAILLGQGSVRTRLVRLASLGVTVLVILP